MGAKDQGSRRSHPQHDKKAMPGSAAAKSSLPTYSNRRGNPPMTMARGKGVSRHTPHTRG